MDGDTADGAVGRNSEDVCRIITYSFETAVGPSSILRYSLGICLGS